MEMIERRGRGGGGGGGTATLVGGAKTEGKRREKDGQRKGGKRHVMEMKLNTWNGEKVGVVVCRMVICHSCS